MYHRGWANVLNPFRSSIYFILADGAPQGKQLPIQVRNTNFIIINQIQRTNAAACQRFYRITANTADAKHSNPALLKMLHDSFPIEQFCSRKLI